MAELTINADEIAAALRTHIESFSPSLAQEQLGRVLEVGDGVARVAGLPDAAVNELLEFEGGMLALALNLDEETIGAVVLGKSDEVEEGQAVQAPGIVGRKPVHEPLQTGIKAVDAMTPVGRGQRELIIGDRKTGKTTVAI